MDNWTGLDEEFARLEVECTEIVKGVIAKTWSSLLTRTPQFLGRMCASWTYSIGSPEFVDRSEQVDPEGAQVDANNFRSPFDFQPLRRGSLEAINVANAANVGKDSAFKLGDYVYFANGVNHGEGSYSGDVEDGNVRLRAVNLPGAPVARTLDYINANFDNISLAQATTLKTLKIGAINASSNS